MHQPPEDSHLKNQIVDGFFIELSEHPFSEIRVAQLIKSAGVARASYYRNFENIEDILNYYLDRLLVKHRSHSDKIANARSWTKLSIKDQLLDLFTVFGAEQKRFKLLIQGELSSHIYEFFQAVSEERSTERPANWLTGYPRDVISGAVFQVIMSWLQKGAQESPEEMANFLIEYLPEKLFEQ
ncbi:TetR-like C-terminal domain-containing protein [Fructobacillus evanidus]|uniref:AcrR family n=1 Tax=Fructobacillus evanidus TaxID=3064281 RepID=A0ABN9YUT0_9LACO|nr:AcrR family [Fructobacillus sp. LMG 32999]CAK1233938.1 AcrR family [Fructobacillus sp. LMG 32999]CAK1235760.1 AcrR family [Fructobacillus sp. LMG 32999]CAK1236482.1 AcrR family [Fructobacillus sp. LMG 32999]CAK1237578.1 AcrR family [Fructobacillus sp. LMG 32999]